MTKRRCSITVTATEESLRAALFGEAPAARVLLGFANGDPIAYATYFFTFATMVGPRVRPQCFLSLRTRYPLALSPQSLRRSVLPLPSARPATHRLHLLPAGSARST